MGLLTLYAVSTSTTRFNEAGARSPGWVPNEGVILQDPTGASMRPGQEAPDGHRGSADRVGRDPRFNEAGARSPGWASSELGGWELEDASMRPGQEAPDGGVGRIVDSAKLVLQ